MKGYLIFHKWKIRVRISVGSSDPKEPLTDDVERFLSMLRFDSREKLDVLGVDVLPKIRKTGD